MAAHPGIAATNLASHAGGLTALISKMTFLQNDPEHGALPTLYAATQDVPGGSYVGPDGIASIKGYPKIGKPSRVIRDAETARQLWDVSSRLTGTGSALLSATTASPRTDGRAEAPARAGRSRPRSGPRFCACPYLQHGQSRAGVHRRPARNPRRMPTQVQNSPESMTSRHGEPRRSCLMAALARGRGRLLSCASCCRLAAAPAWGWEPPVLVTGALHLQQAAAGSRPPIARSSPSTSAALP
ncbi:MAG TPA: hypothetical protein VGH96_07880 [Streptosporangiaceae bacterium]